MKKSKSSKAFDTKPAYSVFDTILLSLRRRGSHKFKVIERRLNAPALLLEI